MIKITEEILQKMREYAQSKISERRYAHTESVEKEIAVLSDIYCPEKKDKLRAAAILHDVTKEYNVEKQLQLCGEYGILIDDTVLMSPKCFHAITAEAVVKDAFGDYVDGEILSAIRYHTTGRKGMSLSEKLLYLADFTESTRTFESCVALRNYFYDGLRSGDVCLHLEKTLLYSFDITIKELIEEHNVIMTDTVEARNYICAAVSELEKNGANNAE